MSERTPVSRRPGPLDSRVEAGERRRRGREEPLQVSVRETSPVPHLRVRNPLHGTQYDLYFPGYPSLEGGLCTCPDFARRGLGTCKHLEAVRLWALEHPDLEPKPRPPGPPAGRLWAEVDRRRSAARGTDGRTLRGVGAVLYDEAVTEP